MRVGSREWRGETPEGREKAQGRHRHETRPDGIERNQGRESVRNAETAAQSGVEPRRRSLLHPLNVEGKQTQGGSSEDRACCLQRETELTRRFRNRL